MTASFRRRRVVLVPLFALASVVVRAQSPTTVTVSPSAWNAPPAGGSIALAVSTSPSSAPWNVSATEWLVSTVINVEDPSGDGLGSLVVDSAGNVFTTFGNAIYKFSPTGERSVFAGGTGAGTTDGTGTAARFSAPSGIAIDSTDNLYVADTVVTICMEVCVTHNGVMNAVVLSELPTREIFPGFTARLIHTERATESWVDATAGASFPEHQHPHEQIVNVLDGELEITVGGVTRRLKAGEVLVIPSEMPHSGRAITNCRVLDVFTPRRDEYR
jgi:quercetin dioxygenase-like cupin family protein